MAAYNMGRWNTKYEAWMKDVAVKLLERGAPSDAYVATFLKVSRTTFQTWLSNGRDEACRDDALVEFVQAYDEAKASYDGEVLDQANFLSQTDGKVMIRMLEARMPETFAPEKRSKVEVTVHKGSNKEDLRFATVEELEELDRLEAVKARIAERKALSSGK